MPHEKFSKFVTFSSWSKVSCREDVIVQNEGVNGSIVARKLPFSTKKNQRIVLFDHFNQSSIMQRN